MNLSLSWASISAAIITTGAVWIILIRWGTPNFRKFVFEVISDPGTGAPLLKKTIETCFEDELDAQKAVANATDDLLGRMEAAELAIKSRSSEMAKIRQSVAQVPELNRILNEIKASNEAFGRRFEAAMDKFTTELAHVREGVARMEGKWDGVERREKQ